MQSASAARYSREADGCACWAFAATGAMEGAWALRRGQLTSQQQLLDCSAAQGNQGCGGGYTSAAFDYVVQAGGACKESDYMVIYAGQSDV